MARSLDQEPNLSASDNSQPNHGPHPERVSTDFGGSTPAHPDWRPDPLDVQPKSKNKLAALIAIGGVAATGVIGAATYFGLRDAGRDFGNRLTGADAANSAPEIPGRETAELRPLDIYNTDISHEDISRQLDVIMPILEQQRSTSAEAWKAEASPAFQQLDPGVFSGKRKDAQRILNNFALDGLTASNQSGSTLKRNLIGGIYTPGTPSYRSVGKQIDDGAHPHDRQKALEVSDPFTNGTVGDYHANGRETIIIKTLNMNKTEEPVAELVVNKVTSASGKYSAWLTEKVVYYGESDFIMDVDNWHPGS